MRSLQLLSTAALLCISLRSAAQLELGPLPATVWCSGTTMGLPYTASGAFNAGNSFIMEISDASGSFTSAMSIGSLSGVTSGTITCTMNGLPPGTGYLVRVRSTDPPLTSDTSATSLTLVAPNAGMDAVLSICTNSPMVNLFSHLVGASPGGVWTDPSGTGALTGMMLQPSSLPPGSYTFIYTIEEMGCTDSATLTVVANAAPTAGVNAGITACSTDAPFTMYQVLGGSPLPGGFWTGPNGGQMNGVFDPGTDPSGVYAYTVMGEPPCMNASATLMIMVNPAANAGVDGTATYCATDAPFTLLQHLGGTPSASGTWTFGGAGHGAVFTPGTDVPGLYTYTVLGVSPCGSATATVTVSPVTCLVNIPANLGIPNMTE